MVQIITILAIFAATLAGVHATDCYQTGPIWCENPPQDVFTHITNACWGYMDGNTPRSGALQNLWFNKNNGLPATVCVNTGCNKKLVMQVWNLQGGGRYLSGQDCQGLLRPPLQCQTGGTNEEKGWRFRAAPEYGQC
ncbi:hypothetical protein B9Z65_7507 [Elsinoe australis]|uniref:Secreted protein n=1 Tax=Elsinoe australis TaxID=40998 RepID=A0A2P7YCD4_9PEZI|nr:hypothetical protein B9Z65_7507 [Elsinoe australis]